MFRHFIMTGLVVFGVVATTPLMAAPAKPDAAVQTGDLAISQTDWVEYGRINPGEMTLAISTASPLKANSFQIPITLTFQNASARDLRLLKVDSGDGGTLMNSILTVTQNGRSVLYQGPMAKIMLDEGAYQTVLPGAAFTNTIDLIRYYPMAIKAGDIVVINYNRYDGVLTGTLTLTAE